MGQQTLGGVHGAENGGDVMDAPDVPEEDGDTPHAKTLEIQFLLFGKSSS